MTVNNRTSSRNYAKPNVANLLSEDVVRLSEALDSIDTDVAGAQSALTTRAPLVSPAFTGAPSAPTPAVDTNTTQVATTAFVLGQASAANPAVNGTAAAGSSSRYARADHIHPIDTSRAPVASPTFTGTPAAPTPAADTNTTQLATTAFVVGQDYTKQTRTVFAGAGLTGGGDLAANRTIAADIATQLEAEFGITNTKLMTPRRVAEAILKLPLSSVLVISSNLQLGASLNGRPRLVVIAAGLTITLPFLSVVGSELSVTIAGNFTNTIIARNGQNIMSLAEDLTIDRADVTVTLLYVDATRGWRII